MDSMEVMLSMVRGGILQVHETGEVWKTAVRDSHQNVIPIRPRRAEHRSRTGYPIVKVSWRNRSATVYAHRLVWTVLRGPIPEGMEINHRDGDKQNNRPSNLELVTSRGNTQHALRTGLIVRGFSRPRRESLTREARALRSQGLTYKGIGRRLGVSQTTAFRAVRGELLAS